MNVTPEMLAPIMATVTISHDDLRPPVKKLRLSALRPVIHERSRSRAEEAPVVGPAARYPRKEQKQGKVACDGEEDNPSSCHKRFGYSSYKR